MSRPRASSTSRHPAQLRRARKQAGESLVDRSVDEHDTGLDRPAKLGQRPRREEDGHESRLSTLWIFASLNYLYCDVASLMDPQLLPQYLRGNVNGLEFTPGSCWEPGYSSRSSSPWSSCREYCRTGRPLDEHRSRHNHDRRTTRDSTFCKASTVLRILQRHRNHHHRHHRLVRLDVDRARPAHVDDVTFAHTDRRGRRVPSACHSRAGRGMIVDGGRWALLR
jgi:hypothetical protein